MASLRVNLLEHISQDNTTAYSIAVGDAEVPTCYSVGEVVKICTTKSDAVGASAIICTLDSL